MKKVTLAIHVFLLLGFSHIGILSCSDKGSNEPKPLNEQEPIAVDSTKLKPAIDIMYQLLDSGYVQLINNTKRVTNAEYAFADDYGERTVWYTREINPKLFFYKNGTKELRVHLRFNENLRDTTFITRIVVINAINTEKPNFPSIIKGEFFNETLDRKVTIVNGFTGGGITVMPPRTPVTNIFLKDGYGDIIFADLNDPKGIDFETMVKNLKPGLKATSKSSGTFKDGWAVFFPYKSNTYGLGDSINDSLLIEQAMVVYQPKIIPEMTDKAILIKMKVAANIEGIGKADLRIQHKYYHYKQYTGGF